jgi:hypothetical protein
VKPLRVVAVCALGAGLTLLASAACPADRLDWLVAGASAADLWTTERALAGPGVREANPLLQSPGARIGGKALATAAVLVGCHQIEKRGHRRAAKVVRILAVVTWSGAAVNNAIQARRAK